MNPNELEAIRARLEAARRQWLPAGARNRMRIIAIQFADGFAPGAPVVVYGVDEGFSAFLLTAREDVRALLEELEASRSPPPG